MNVDVNKIECETCGAQLSFTDSASWTSAAEGIIQWSMHVAIILV